MIKISRYSIQHLYPFKGLGHNIVKQNDGKCFTNFGQHEDEELKKSMEETCKDLGLSMI